jgi:hypothetical protein
MSESPETLRAELIRRVRQWLDHFKAEEAAFASECSFEFTVNGVKQTGDPWDAIRLEELSTEELKQLDEVLPAIAAQRTFMMTPEFQRHLEHQCFAEYLKQRQGTALPDFESLYREREKLERKLRISLDRRQRGD